MMNPLLAPLPRLTVDLPGIGGQIKNQLDDFLVEEIPAYEPCGEGEHLYLWIEKRDMGADYFLRQIAQRLDVPKEAIGMAGLKDRRAVTRQWVSVPAAAAERLGQLASDDLRLLKQSRHGNKLRPGHLHGNRFAVRIRGVATDTLASLAPLLERLKTQGFPNYYGEQRFGREGETLELGLKLLRGEQRPLRNRFLQKLALSAVQSALFNRTLARRLEDGLLQHVLPGDVMMKLPAGGIFAAEDVAAEQARFGRREIVPTGPMFGRKMFPAAAVAKDREEAVLREAGLKADDFAGFGNLLAGTRRPLLCFVSDLEAEASADSALLRFSLPAGSYATVLLDEVMKSAAASSAEEPADAEPPES